MLSYVIVAAILTQTCFCYDWNYFTFSQQWPPGTCAAGEREHHQCLIPSEVTTWTVHGLWPSVYDSREPHDCNSSWHFDINKLSSIRDDLEMYWPNLYDDTPVDSFWEHEWSKHGTCCTDLSDTANELQYFSKGIALNRLFDMSSMLSDSGIVPSLTASYSYKDFMDAVKKAVGFEPVLECAVSTMKNGTKLHMIGQIEICLDKHFKPRDCYTKEINRKVGKPSSYKNRHIEEKTLHSDALHYKSHHHSGTSHQAGPQSNCPTHYEFYYPPMHYKFDGIFGR